jgi:hypothetical protein
LALCKSSINSIEEALIQLRYAMADYYSCREAECVGLFSALDAPLRELRKVVISTQTAINLLPEPRSVEKLYTTGS